MTSYGNESGSSDSFDTLGPAQAGKDCRLLFDELFNNDENDYLEVRKPAQTYSRKRQPLSQLNIRNNRSDKNANVNGYVNNDADDDDDASCQNNLYDEDEQYGISDDKNERKKQRPKVKRKAKKKVNNTKCTKETVLEAFEKAIQSKELPDFDAIDKFQLNIVYEKSPEPKIDDCAVKIDSRPSKRKVSGKSKQDKISTFTTEIEVVKENEDKNKHDLTLSNISNFNLNCTSNVITSTPKVKTTRSKENLSQPRRSRRISTLKQTQTKKSEL